MPFRIGFGVGPSDPGEDLLRGQERERRARRIFRIVAVVAEYQDVQSIRIADPDLIHTKSAVDLDGRRCRMSIDHFDRQVGWWVGTKVDLLLAADSRRVGHIVGLVPFDPTLLLATTVRRLPRLSAKDVQAKGDLRNENPQEFLEILMAQRG